MRAMTRAALLLAVPVLLASCGTDDLVGVRPDLLEGDWSATAIEFVNRANPTEVVDLIEQGAAGELTLDADHTFRFAVMQTGLDPEVFTGEWHVSGSKGESVIFSMEMQGEPVSWAFAAKLAGANLTLDGASTSYDFNGDGTVDPATLNLAFRRQ